MSHFLFTKKEGGSDWHERFIYQLKWNTTASSSRLCVVGMSGAATWRNYADWVTKWLTLPTNTSELGQNLICYCRKMTSNHAFLAPSLCHHIPSLSLSPSLSLATVYLGHQPVYLPDIVFCCCCCCLFCFFSTICSVSYRSFVFLLLLLFFCCFFWGG